MLQRPAVLTLSLGTLAILVLGAISYFLPPATEANAADPKAPGKKLAATGEKAAAETPGVTKTSSSKPIVPAKAAIGFETKAKPFLAKYCVSCHKASEPEAGVALDGFASLAYLHKERKTWDKVLRQLRVRGMPPEDPKPSTAELDAFVGYIESELAKFDCNGPRDPGRVTIRRLNRSEYENTVRDLVGIEFKADDFPSDDVGYGFDNIGDVLSLPPVLMEKYLASAEKIAHQAIVTGDQAKFAKKKYEAEKVGGSGGGAAGDAFNLYSTGEVVVDHDFPSTGEYVLRVRAWGQQAGPEPCKLALKLDGKELKSFEIKATEARPEQIEFKTQIPAGKHKIAAAFTNDFYDPKHPDPNQRDRNLLIDFIEILGPEGQGPVLPEPHTRVVFVKPGPNKKPEDAAKEIAERLVTRAFRRPATPAEVAQYAKLFDIAKQQGDSFEHGAQLALTGVLVSPHFLFRIELDQKPTDSGATRPLTEYELATRLSYFLWSSMPDEELLNLAKQGQLKKNLDAQVRRMLKDPKTQELTANFAGQWLQLRNLKTVAPDKRRFPTWDENLRNDMAKETELFFEEIVKQDRSVLDFLDADFTFLNERMAKHYGINDGPKGDQFQRVSLKSNQRGGVLTHASVLTVTSNPTRTSPVKRGKWILEQMLGTPPPPPPPGVPELVEEKRGQLSGSLRQKMEQHRSNPACASCHAALDPLGFGLENFDAIGQWRDKEGKFDIDSSGVLPTGESFKGPGELKKILAGRKDQFTRALAEKMLTYALGRGLEFYDKCALDGISAKLAKQEYKFSSLILAVVQSEPFLMRRGDGDEP